MSEFDDAAAQPEPTGFAPTLTSGPQRRLPAPPHETPSTDTGDTLGHTLPLSGDPARPQPAPPNTPPLLGRFRLVERLGEGGMGEVWRAYDLDLHADVALKTVRPDLAGRAELIEMMRSEVLLARQVSHPNVCRLFEFFVGHRPDGDPVAFFTMELLEGVTLSRFLRQRGRLAAREALPLLREMAAGLDAAHAAGVVHRDFKPGNVMLVEGDPRRRAVVMDFGVALTGDSGGGGGVPVGTPAYMAPEQARGERTTARSDVYAFGLVAREMVAGAGTGLEGVPRPWRAPLRRALAENAEERLGSASELLRGLERVRWRRRLALASLAAVLLVAGAGWKRAVDRQARVRQLLVDAREMQYRYDWPEELRLVDQALALDPRSGLGHHLRAAALGFLGRRTEAKVEREAAIQSAPRLPPAERLLVEANYWASVGNREKGAQLAAQLYALAPDDLANLRLRAYFLEPKERLELYRKVRLAGSPITRHPYFQISEAVRASEAGDEKGRVEALDRLDALQPGPEFRYLLATALTIRESHHFNVGEWEEALRLLASAEEIYKVGGPEYEIDLAKVVERRALVYRSKHEYSNAAESYNRAAEIFQRREARGDLCLTLAHQSDALIAQGLLRQAAEALAKVETVVTETERRSDPTGNCRDYWFDRSLLARATGNLPLAHEVSVVSQKLYPISGAYGMVLQLERATLAYEEGRYAEALEQLEAMKGNDVPVVQSPFQELRARVALELGRRDVAQDALSRLEAGGGNESMRRAHAYVQAELGLQEGTRPAARRALAVLESVEPEQLDFLERIELDLLKARLRFVLGPSARDASRLRDLLEWARTEGARSVELEVQLVRASDPARPLDVRRLEARRIAAESERLGFRRLASKARTLPGI